MKRFWKTATAAEGAEGWEIMLDGRPVRTPGRLPLRLPGQALAEAVASEWNAAGDKVDPRAMPLTGLANAAIDRVAPAADVFAQGLARYAVSDLLCYRSEGPAPLVERQSAHWDKLLHWARRRYDVDFVVTQGITPVDQSADTLARLGQAVAALGPFALAGMSPLVTVGGSLVAALAVYEQASGVDEAWTAVSLDEAWQLEQWGSDSEAEKALAAREGDFRAGARFLDLLRA